MSNFIKTNNVYKHFTKEDRKIFLDAYVLNKEYIYKSIEDVKEQNERAEKIADEVFTKYHSQFENKKNELEKKSTKPDQSKLLVQPYNFDYYLPISGDTVTQFVENPSRVELSLKSSKSTSKLYKSKSKNKANAESDPNSKFYKSKKKL